MDRRIGRIAARRDLATLHRGHRKHRHQLPGHDGVNGKQPLPVRGKLRCDDTDSLLHAAIGGAGILHLANWLVSDAVVAGQLVPVFPMQAVARNAAPPRRDPMDSAIHAVHMPGRSNQAKAQLLIRHLKEYFGSPPYWDLAMEAAGAGERRAP